MNTLFNHYDSLSQWCGGCFSAICRINLKKGKSCQINSWQVWAQRKITIISCFTHLRRSALHPPPQCTASLLAVHCIRPCKYVHPSSHVLASRSCKYVFFYWACTSPKPYLDSLWPIWHVSSVAQIHAEPISVGFERFWEYFWNSNGKLFLRIWSKMSESEERENVRGFVWSDPVMIR